MKKPLVFMGMLFLSAVLLSACQNTGAEADYQPASPADTGITEAPAAVHGEAEESVAEAEAEAGTELQSGSETYPAEDSVLYEADDLSIRLIRAKDLELGSVFYTLKIINNSGAALELEISNLTVNHVYHQKGILQSFESEPGKTAYRTCSFLNRMLEPAEIAEVRDLAFDLRYTEKDKEEWTEKSVQAEISYGRGASVLVEPYLDAKAGEQVLADNENVRITLLFCGRLLGRYGDRLNQLYGIVCFENKSREDIPVGVCTASVNRKTIDPNVENGGGSQILPPGKICYIPFYLYEDLFLEQKIDSIESLSIMLLSDFSEVTGTYSFENSLDGGSWYDVALSEAGMAEDSKPEGKPVFDNGSVQVYYNTQSSEKRSYAGEDSYTGYWNCTAVNTGEETVEIDITDIRINGEPQKEGLFEGSVYSSGPVVAPGKRADFDIVIYDWNSQTLPELDFRFRIRSPGGGAILYEAGERCVFPSG